VYIDDHFEYDKERKAQKELWGKQNKIEGLTKEIKDLKEECVMLQIDRQHLRNQLEDARKQLANATELLGRKPLTDSDTCVTQMAFPPNNGNDIDSAVTRIKDVLEQYQERQYKLRHENKYRDLLIAVWKSIGALDEQIQELMQDEKQ
jgi:predicted  nucleic acid-binding Zn-ribbon protein